MPAPKITPQQEKEVVASFFSVLAEIHAYPVPQPEALAQYESMLRVCEPGREIKVKVGPFVMTITRPALN